MPTQYAYYRPTTPPDAPLSAAHSRHASDSSVYSTDASSPWSATTSATSPGGSPPRKLHHGPALLPKIRPQDVVVEPAPPSGSQRQRRTRDPSGPVPYAHSSASAQRSSYLASPAAPAYISSNSAVLLSPVSITSSHKRKASSSPEGHSRYTSESRNREALDRYGYPMYRQLPRYIVPSTPVAPNIIVHPPYLQQRSTTEYTIQSPPVAASKTPQYYYQHPYARNVQPYSVGSVYRPEEVDAPPTTMLSYLTAPTQAIKLVRNVNVVPTRGMHDYFWWDIRNLRSWTSFHPSTFDSIDCLTKLLTTEIPSSFTPSTMVHPSRLAPECETTLIGLINDIYAPRVNAALGVSQGPNHLRLYPAPGVRTSVNKNYGGPHFLVNYATDTDQTSSGLPRGRLVGIVRSFDRWNTGMRKEAEPRRVEYLNGLAHLQRCMREHGCRYGFIMTEIELVCVRAGCDSRDGDAVPYFGFLEISAPIPAKIASDDDDGRFHSPALSSTSTDGLSSSTSSTRSRSRSRSSSHSPIPPCYNTYTHTDTKETLDVPLTTTLALYFLLMLSKDTPLPSQPSPHINVGGPGALTRQKVLPEGRDAWIPKAHTGEMRDAKRVRGWVWPEDPWHRREGGGVASRGRGKGSAGVDDNVREGEGVSVKRWHK